MQVALPLFALPILRSLSLDFTNNPGLIRGFILLKMKRTPKNYYFVSPSVQTILHSYILLAYIVPLSIFSTNR